MNTQTENEPTFTDNDVEVELQFSDQKMFLSLDLLCNNCEYFKSLRSFHQNDLEQIPVIELKELTYEMMTVLLGSYWELEVSRQVHDDDNYPYEKFVRGYFRSTVFSKQNPEVLDWNSVTKAAIFLQCKWYFEGEWLKFMVLQHTNTGSKSEMNFLKRNLSSIFHSLLINDCSDLPVREIFASRLFLFKYMESVYCEIEDLEETLIWERWDKSSLELRTGGFTDNDALRWTSRTVDISELEYLRDSTIGELSKTFYAYNCACKEIDVVHNLIRNSAKTAEKLKEISNLTSTGVIDSALPDSNPNVKNLITIHSYKEFDLVNGKLIHEDSRYFLKMNRLETIEITNEIPGGKLRSVESVNSKKIMVLVDDDEFHKVVLLEINKNNDDDKPETVHAATVKKLWTATEKPRVDDEMTSKQPTYSSQIERLGFFSSNFLYGTDINCPTSKYKMLALYGSARPDPLNCLAVIDTTEDTVEKDLKYLENKNEDENKDASHLYSIDEAHICKDKIVIKVYKYQNFRFNRKKKIGSSWYVYQHSGSELEFKKIYTCDTSDEHVKLCLRYD